METALWIILVIILVIMASVGGLIWTGYNHTRNQRKRATAARIAKQHLW